MKTTLLATLLLAGMLVPMTTALADGPVDDALNAFWTIESCVEAIVGPDGQNEQVLGRDTGVDVVDQRPVCLN